MFGSQTKKDASLETVEEEAGTPTSLEASAPEASVEESAPSKPKSNFWGGSASKSFTGLGESSSSSAAKVNAQLKRNQEKLAQWKDESSLRHQRAKDTMSACLSR